MRKDLVKLLVNYLKLENSWMFFYNERDIRPIWLYFNTNLHVIKHKITSFHQHLYIWFVLKTF